MQKTTREHAASAERGRSCASCHMTANERGRHGHGFAASRDPALLSAALEVDASRDAEGQAVFTLASRGVGHAFPTGDLFRRLVLRVTTRGVVFEHPLGRTFRATRDASGAAVRFEATDERLSSSRRIVLPLSGKPGELAWEVTYQRVTGVQQTPPFAVDVEAETVLARGKL